MNKNQVKKYLISKLPLKDPKVSLIGSGNNYNVFLINENGRKFALRAKKRNDMPICNNLEYEYFILKFLEEEGIEFIQKPVFFDKEKKISILTYIPGKEVAVSDLNEKQLELFISQIVKINNLSYERYKSFCERNGIKIQLPKTPLKHIKSFIKAFRYVKKNCDEKKLVRWIETRIKIELEYIKKELKYKRREIIFDHFDLAGANIVLYKRKMYFIDWDKSMFSYGRYFVLPSIFVHDDKLSINKEKQSKILELYAEYSDIDKNELLQKTKRVVCIVKLFGIIWAAKLFTRMKKLNLEGWKKYRELTYERIKNYKIN